LEVRADFIKIHFLTRINNFMLNNSKRKVKITKQPISESATRIKVQLDHKTMMVVHSMAAFKMWKKRYPLARVIA
jgi:hypothetical protein